MNGRPRLSDLPPVKVTSESLREAARLYAYLWPYRGKFIAAMSCLLVSSLMGLAFPFLTGRLIDSAQRALGEAPPAEDYFGGVNVNTVAMLLMAALAIQAACSFMNTFWLAQVGENGLADLRLDIYSRLIHLPMAFFAQRRVGELTSRISADLSQINSALTSFLPQLLRQSVLLVGGVTLIALTSLRLTVVMLLSFPVLMIVAVIFGKKVRKLAREAQDKLADTHVVIEETLQGIASVKAFSNEEFETSRYRSGVSAFVTAILRVAKLRGIFGAFVTFAIFGSIVLVMWYGARLVEERVLSFGGLTQFLLYTMYVGGSVGSFAELYAQLQQTVGATQRVRELLREPPEESDGKTSAGPRIAGRVALDHVTFSYPSRTEVTVLRDLSLKADAGERIALVGPSGAGKTTIISLVLRFYNPDIGQVLIDDRPARDFPLKFLRSQMAVVPQDVLLFGGTIAENIGYGKPGASQADIENAARLANAHEFIASFPEGYQTVVGERGVKLSGGQRQRVAIARAILRDPAILLLDEATSSLDSESERLVQQALETLMEGRTSIVIAHRLATVRKADRIYVIKEGTLAESGTHAELIAHPGGVYRTLSELQFDMGESEDHTTTR
jgi:ATP-binding cassette subfamily B protein